MPEAVEQTEEYERCHALKAGFTQSKAYLIDSEAFNHMVASKESFTTLNLSGGPRIHIGDDSEMRVVGRGSIKI